MLWERKGNVPALTDLFRAYIVKGMNDIVAGNHLPGVLGVFQKLLASKVRTFNLTLDSHRNSIVIIIFHFMLPTGFLSFIGVSDYFHSLYSIHCSFLLFFIQFFIDIGTYRQRISTLSNS